MLRYRTPSASHAGHRLVRGVDQHESGRRSGRLGGVRNGGCGCSARVGPGAPGLAGFGPDPSTRSPLETRGVRVVTSVSLFCPTENWEKQRSLSLGGRVRDLQEEILDTRDPP